MGQWDSGTVVFGTQAGQTQLVNLKVVSEGDAARSMQPTGVASENPRALLVLHTQGRAQPCHTSHSAQQYVCAADGGTHSTSRQTSSWLFPHRCQSSKVMLQSWPLIALEVWGCCLPFSSHYPGISGAAITNTLFKAGQNTARCTAVIYTFGGKTDMPWL